MRPCLCSVLLLTVGECRLQVLVGGGVTGNPSQGAWSNQDGMQMDDEGQGKQQIITSAVLTEQSVDWQEAWIYSSARSLITGGTHWPAFHLLFGGYPWYQSWEGGDGGRSLPVSAHLLPLMGCSYSYKTQLLWLETVNKSNNTKYCIKIIYVSGPLNYIKSLSQN